MKGRRSGHWRLALAVGGILFVVALLVLASFRTVVRVNVRSVPEGATIFDGRSALGFAPLSLSLARGETRTLRIVRRDYRDAAVELRADSFIPSGPFGELRAALRRRPGEVTVRLQPVVEEDPAMIPATTSITSEPDKVKKFIRAAILKDPGDMDNYSELARHFVLMGSFSDAAAALREGFTILSKPGTVILHQVHSGAAGTTFMGVIYEIHMRYFVYPPETPDNEIHTTCRELMRAAVDKNVLNTSQTWQQRLAQMDSYDATHPTKARPREEVVKGAK